MKRSIILAAVLSVVTLYGVVAQSFVSDDLGDEMEDMLVGVDLTLFRHYTLEVDPYGEATKYYRPTTSRYRRGLEWWLAEEFVNPLRSVVEEVSDLEEERRVRLYGSTQDYQIGLSASLSTQTSSGWGIVSRLDLRSGSDMNIDGVFRQELNGDLHLSKSLRRGGLLSFTVDLPLSMRGLQSGASQEAITLTGDNLYNPAWGLYDGEVRNSRVSTYYIPEVDIHFQHPISKSTTLILGLASQAGRRGITRLSWYDATNPQPDYYRNMPSYYSQDSNYDVVTEVWRNQDPNYTQIAWDDLIAVNQLSPDGDASYAVEDQVEISANVDLEAIFCSDVGGGVDLIYGVGGRYESSRRFKEMEDLLGAEYLFDYDLFVGDYDNTTTNMQNDLRNPDRKVGVGDRFGYDYTISGRGISFVLGAEYHKEALSLRVRGKFEEYAQWRTGHFEKERFSGDDSYGDSQSVAMSRNELDLSAGYSLGGRHNISLRGVWRTIPIDGSDLFIQVQSANRIIDDPTPRRVGSLELGYKYDAPHFSLDLSGYLLYSRDETQVWSCYDDFSYTYADVVVQGLSSRSLGLDLVGRYKVSSRLNWNFALTLGDYTYDQAPSVTLYDDSDMSLLAVTTSSALEGCKVGNAPQLLASSSLTFFADRGVILTLNGSYSAGNYIAPSIVRRTDRITLQAGSVEQLQSIVEQEALASIFDLSASIVKTIFLPNDRRLSFNFRVNNLLGVRDRVEYARESNRLLRTSGGSSTGVRYLEANRYIYGTPRTFYLSGGYYF